MVQYVHQITGRNPTTYPKFYINIIFVSRFSTDLCEGGISTDNRSSDNGFYIGSIQSGRKRTHDDINHKYPLILTVAVDKGKNIPLFQRNLERAYV